MEYSDVTTQLTNEWRTGNIELPSMFDKNLLYNTQNSNRLFLDIYSDIELKEISVGKLQRRNQIGEIHGIYDSYANCEKALIETKRALALKRGWHVDSDHNKIIKKRSFFLFILKFIERITIIKSDW
jgi:hypothetical protein